MEILLWIAIAVSLIFAISQIRELKHLWLELRKADLEAIFRLKEGEGEDE